MDAKQPEGFPSSFKISRQLDQEKIDFLTQRVEELLNSNNKLRASSSQNEKDTHDIVLYFQREMEMKDDIVLRLNEELVKCQTQLKFEVDKLKKEFEDELAEIRSTSEKTISDLTARLDSTEADLKAIEIYRQEKDLHEGTVARLEKAMMSQREQLIDAMEEQERRFLEEKSQLFKDLDEQKAAFREVALKEARSAMGEEVKKILSDNERMFEELKFHHSEAADYQTEKASLSTELSTARRDIELFSEKEIEYAKQAHNRSKEIKALRERVEQLEKQQAENLERFKTRAKELKATVNKELAEATLDAAGLRRLIQIKNKELRQMKSLASTILSQRSETEQFFLEALQEVKEVIRRERKMNFQQTRIIATQMRTGAGAGAKGTASSATGAATGAGAGRGGTWGATVPASGRAGAAGKTSVSFPPLNIKGSSLQYLEGKPYNEVTMRDFEKVAINELSWEDKELVLRVLFAKMNGMQGKINKAVADVAGAGAAGAQKPGTGRGQDRGIVQNRPVFISEGAGMLSGEDAEYNALEEYQSNFEVAAADGDGGGGGGAGFRAEFEGEGSMEGGAVGGREQFEMEFLSPNVGKGVDTGRRLFSAGEGFEGGGGGGGGIQQQQGLIGGMGGMQMSSSARERPGHHAHF